MRIPAIERGARAERQRASGRVSWSRSRHLLSGLAQARAVLDCGNRADARDRPNADYEGGNRVGQGCSLREHKAGAAPDPVCRFESRIFTTGFGRA